MTKHNIVKDYLDKPVKDLNSFILKCCFLFDDDTFSNGEIKFSQDTNKYTFTKDGKIYYEENK